ncbi:unnamed protein product [Mytilus coruscus]|uniref:Uncharacterized protein n=1 Tax=Mytilus coruscus TaxID=42192 RepID=A0A6J8BW37_MYTCO|nr:unnamed protein product [Mytilus coruscus]
MAQVLAVPGDVRHGFSYNCSFNHDFGRITGIAATRKGNILLCDYEKKNLILVDSLGKYLKKLTVDSEPYDLAITIQNIGYVTQPNTRTVLKIDPDRIVILTKATCNELHTNVLCVSAVPYTSNSTVYQNSVTCFLSVDTNRLKSIFGICSNNFCLIDISRYPFESEPVYDTGKFHAVNDKMLCYCLASQNDILVGNPPKTCSIASLIHPLIYALMIMEISTSVDRIRTTYTDLHRMGRC